MYLCTRPECPARSGISAARLDAWVEGLLQDAVLAGEPHLTAILDGDHRYEKALEAVEAERAELEAWRDGVRVSDVGIEAWKAGLASRQAGLDLARKALREIPAPKQPYTGKHPAAGIKGATKNAERVRAVEAAMNREANGRFLARVIVKPVGRGRRVPVAERVAVWFVGAEEAVDVAALMPDKTVEIVQADTALSLETVA